ncbi:9209_t:CDS:1, partial [Racocetra fulgida]
QTAQKALLKDADITQSLHEIKMKELKNELEQVTQNSSFRDGLIFCLRSRISDLEDELEQISLKPDPLSNDSKTDGDAVEEVSNFSKTPSFPSRYSELKPDESKIKDVVELLIDYTCNKQKKKLDNISALPIVALGGSKAL